MDSLSSRLLFFLLGSASGLGGALIFISLMWATDRLHFGPKEVPPTPQEVPPVQPDAGPEVADEVLVAETNVDTAIEGDPSRAPQTDPELIASCDMKQADSPWHIPHPEDGAKLAPVNLAMPEGTTNLDRRAQFWAEIWGKYGDGDFVITDRRRPWVRYSVISCEIDKEDKRAKSRCYNRTAKERKRLRAMLKKARKRPPRWLRKKFSGSRAQAKNAYQNVITIQGRRDALQRALDRAAPYLEHAERVFEKHGVPAIYARLGVVESLFRADAISKSGAVGAYQFVRLTGKEWMRVDEPVDERLDPVRAAAAAAQYLRTLHDRFNDWPLAITAYNTGPTRLRKLIKEHGTKDLGKIIGKIAAGGQKNDRGFGRDGQNYYAQMAAVASVTADLRAPEMPLPSAPLMVEKEAPFMRLANCLKQDPKSLGRANPALNFDVIEGNINVPNKYLLSLPMTQGVAVTKEESSNAANTTGG